ncbi:MAG: hypothetical protein HYT97_04920 [Elusimicrobia bacterium]|nr:hypothetical protein [Elusimicrobiota bacterium]
MGKEFFVEMIPNPIVVTDECLSILYLNPAALSHFPDLKKLGGEHPVLQELNILCGQMKNSQGELIAFVRNIVADKKFYEEEIFCFTKKNKVYIYLIDISERKRVEADLKMSHAELQNANLKMGELLVFKDKFIANIAHELKTPVTIIMESSKLLEDGLLGIITDEQRKFIKILGSASQRLTILINNILDSYKIHSGQIRLILGKHKIHGLIMGTLQETKSLLGKRRIKCEGPDDLEASVDPDKIKQVLRNLLMNAIKFTSSDGWIRVTLWEEGGNVCVAITDNGVGIAKEDLPKLFLEFSQVGDYKAGGTGLGLSICKNILEQHGGNISIASEIGKGTVVTFKLPIYTPKNELEQCFQLFKKSLSDHPLSGTIILTVFDCKPLLIGTRANLEELKEFIRPQLKSLDHVTVLEPQWLVILSTTDMKGAQAIRDRIGKAVNQWRRDKGCGVSEEGLPVSIGAGNAFYGVDGDDLFKLLRHAQEETHHTNIFLEQGGS